MRICCLLLSTAWLVACITGCSGPGQPPQRSISPLPAPDFTLKALDGTQMSSQDLKGKIVVLNFWATWSPGSAREIPELIRLRHEIKNPNVVFLGICVASKSGENIQAFAHDMNFNYPVAVVESSFYEQFGGIDAIPSTLIIDPDWRLVNRYTGRLRIEELNTELDYMQSELKHRK
ncbi:MAG: redoxin domain-containing protein [Methylacidiphilales bacterium]|nr:redoxin domain-containing protein [Candidatus Methylacidiphilales bacterium]